MMDAKVVNKTPDTLIQMALIRSSHEGLPVLSDILAPEVQDIFSVHCENSLDSAIESLQELSVDVVLLDLGVGEISLAISRLKDIDTAIPIIVVGGSEDMDIASRAVKVGAQDYMLEGKDDLQSIHRTVRYAIERERVEEALRRSYDEMEMRVQERTDSLRQLNEMLTQEVAERKLTERRLRSEHELNSAILNTVDALVMVLSRSGNIIQLNRACEIKFGKSATDLYGGNILDLMPFEKLDCNRENFAQLLFSDHDESFECALSTDGGMQRTVHWTVALLHNPDAQTGHILLTGVDITEQRQHESFDRQALLSHAHTSRLTTMGEMATEIAHELNQPLAAIASYSNSCLRLLEEERPNLGDIHEALAEIEHQAHRSADIIKHIRSFVKKETIRNEKLDINNLVENIVELIDIEVRSHNVDLEVNLGKGLPENAADRILLEQVLLNLVRNAIDAMDVNDRHSRKLRIETSCNTLGQAVVSVSDNGPGVVNKEKLFDAFYTTKQDGIGMGLSISQSIIKSYGGRIWEDGGKLGGARFNFTLGNSES